MAANGAAMVELFWHAEAQAAGISSSFPEPHGLPWGGGAVSAPDAKP